MYAVHYAFTLINALFNVQKVWCCLKNYFSGTLTFYTRVHEWLITDPGDSGQTVIPDHLEKSDILLLSSAELV